MTARASTVALLLAGLLLSACGSGTARKTAPSASGAQGPLATRDARTGTGGPGSGARAGHAHRSATAPAGGGLPLPPASSSAAAGEVSGKIGSKPDRLPAASGSGGLHVAAGAPSD